MSYADNAGIPVSPGNVAFGRVSSARRGWIGSVAATGRAQTIVASAITAYVKRFKVLIGSEV
jgi:hypothetical protein